MVCEWCSGTLVPIQETPGVAPACITRRNKETGELLVCPSCLHTAYMRAVDDWHEEEMAHRKTKDTLQRLKDIVNGMEDEPWTV